MGCGPSNEDYFTEPRPTCPINSMPFLIQRTHALGTDLPEHKAEINRMDIIDQVEANAEFLKSYEAKPDDNCPACLRGDRVREYLKMLFMAKAGLKPP